MSVAINSMKGPDGIPIEIYKTFRTKLTPPLLEMYQESLDSGSLPPSLNTAVITLLLKPRKTSTFVELIDQYTLLNNDLKILCKVSARWLEVLLPKMVHSDQDSFVQECQGFHNIRRVLNSF